MQNSIINTLLGVVAWHYEKINDMKQTSIHHEILLLTGTTLVSKQFTSTNSHGGQYSAIEELEKACWNGILHKMFPEILSDTHPKCESFLWNVLTGKNFLYVNMGGSPERAAHETSIDPYLFMMHACES